MRSIDRPGAAGRPTSTLAFFALLAASTAAAEAPSLVLDHLTVEDGLPQATVMTTLQDSHGFVWLGTEDGLVRFDGREIPRPPHWGGYRVIPLIMEFWQDRPHRLHERRVFLAQDDGNWAESLAYP